MNPLRLTSFPIILCFFTGAAYAITPQVTATINALGAENMIRSDISRTTFGSGIEHQTPQFRTLMTSPSATQTAIKNMNMGNLRFPNGTTALFYYWNMPKSSYISASGVQPADLLTPDEIYNFTDTSALNMQRLFQVNTIQYLSPDFVIHPVITPNVSPVTINPDGLTLASQSAANWVADNLSRPASQRVNYWEVGNEDWVYWTPGEYAAIFNTFAAKMKAKSPSIKLLAQSFTGSINLPGKAPNDHNWLQGLISSGINPNNVYALSEHEYISGGNFTTGSDNDKRIWQTQNMFAQVANSWQIPYLKNVLASNNLNWKIWMTEFNVAPYGPNGEVTQLQDLGQALVIADWTGKMLEQGVERMFMLSLDHNPYYALINYVNAGGTIAAPRTTVPGYAFTKYAQNFGSKMVTTTFQGNPTLSSPNNGNYAQVAVYSSVVESDPIYSGFPAMHVMVINRSTVDEAAITLKTLNRPIAGPSKNYTVQTLTSANISDSNKNVTDYVKWSTPMSVPSNTAGITRTLSKNSASFFIIPLQ